MSVIELTVGSRLWLDGEIWTVQELSGNAVVLNNDQHFRRVSVSAVVAQAQLVSEAATTRPEPQEDWELTNVVLGKLTSEQESELSRRAQIVRGLLQPPSGAGSTLQERIRDCSARTGLSNRTLERWISGYRNAGIAGLADKRLLRARKAAVDPRWDAACIEVLDQYIYASTPTMNVLIDKVRQRLDDIFGAGAVEVPSRTTAYRRIRTLAKGRHAFGSAKNRQSVAERPSAPYGRLRATRPGEYVVLDTTPLDVFAMEPVTLRWVPVELTVAQDLFTRCILGLRLSPGSTNSADVANVLYQCVTPQPNGDDDGTWPFHGVPRNILMATEEPDGISQERVAGMPACLPEAIVVDHGRVYLSDHIIAACARLGISIQPATPYKPTDKPTIERFFKTLREGLLQHLPGYKGPDVYNRGKDVEDQAFYYVAELEQIIREWVGQIYHHDKHDGLSVPEIPGLTVSPAEMFQAGLAKTGGLLLPENRQTAFSFLEVKWRTIQHYGVEVDGRRYDGPALNFHRNTQSPYGGQYAGKWPVFVDAHDVRRVWFQTPESKTFEPLEWEHASGLNQPFSRDAAEYTKKIALEENRHVDPAQAVNTLLASWSQETVESRRDKALARRLSAARPGPDQPVDEATMRSEAASIPGVLDFTAAHERKHRQEPVDDLDDVFEEFFSEDPDRQVEVFNE